MEKQIFFAEFFFVYIICTCEMYAYIIRINILFL